MKSILFMCLLILLSCKGNLGSKNQNQKVNPEVFTQKDTFDFKMFMYTNDMLLRNEFPITKEGYFDIFRLHYNARFGKDYTYGIIRQSVDSRIIVYYKENDKSGEFMGRGRLIKQNELENIGSKLDRLLQLIEENNFFELEDGRKSRNLGETGFFILEIKNNSEYREIYKELYSKNDTLWQVKLLFEEILNIADIPYNPMF